MSSSAKGAVRALWSDLRGSPPEVIRDAFLVALPEIVDLFGSASGEIAAEHFEELTGLSAEPSGGPVDEQVQAQVRYRAGALWSPSQEDMLSAVLVDLDKYVKAHGRNTTYDNAERHGVRYARVPSGSKTCAFCMVLASRDAVYLTRGTAGARDTGNEYHGDCDCSVVPVRDRDDLPEGYDSVELYHIYAEARDEASEPNDLHEIVSIARRQRPDMFTDGVH